MGQPRATNSADVNQVEGGTNAPAETKSSQAGDELSPGVKDEAKERETMSGTLAHESSTPLFLGDSPEGNKGNAQDEKDERGE
jgi:hypothetical protein